MFETRNRPAMTALAAALVSAVAVASCSASKEGDPLPAPASQVFKAEFSTTTGRLPYPIDLFFAGSTDGTLNLPTLAFRPAANQAALNSQDGWSTSAPITASFSLPVKESSLTPASVVVLEMYLSNTTKGPATGAELPQGVTSPVIRPLTLGTDYTVTLSDDVDSDGRFIKITPLVPLRPSTGATNIGYLVILTDGIQDESGAAATADDQYASYKSAPDDCSSFSPSTQTTDYGLCLLTKAHLQIANAIGISPADVVETWSFTTQSVDDTLATLNLINLAQLIAVVPTGLTTHDANAGLQGKADIYAGFTEAPYYLTPAASSSDRSILTQFWTAAGPSPVPGIDPASRNLTRFNPVPATIIDHQKIPLLVTVPNATAAGGACSKPASGWPVAVVQHGITGNRTQALAIADAFADACFVVVSADLPLHGLKPDYNEDGNGVDNTSPLYCSSTTPNPICMGAVERTFNVDLVNNSNTSSAVPDGKVDPSGTHFINLPSPATSRDNLRQASSDLMVLIKSLANLDLNGDAAGDVDTSRISLVGLSFGSIAGVQAAQYSTYRTASLSVPGGVITQLLLDSPTFGPRIIAGVGSSGLTQDSYLYHLYVRDFQAILDSGDPINHIYAAQAHLPLHLLEVQGDTVVPNSATERLIAAGGLQKLTTIGPTPVVAGSGAYTLFSQGSHGTLFDPTASLAATIEMQTEVVKFAATAIAPGGPFVFLTNPAVLDLN